MPSFVQVRPADLADWLIAQSADGTAVLLDVREAWELQTASVAASAALPQGMRLMHVPMRELPVRVSELDAQAPTAVLCHHGVRSLHAGHWLAQRGFDQLANVQGGINAWALEADSTIPLY